MSDELTSIVLPHLDDFEGLDKCLTLLMAQTMSPNAYEIIVVDNGSVGGLAAVERTVAGRARVLMVGQRGAGPARNAGVLASSGNIIVFIDSDCCPSPEWLEKGLEALQTSSVVGGRMVVLVDDVERMSSAEAFEKVFAFRNKRYVTKVGFTVTASMFLHRKVFDAVGGFENFVPEDVEWCRRARKIGFTIGYAEDAVIGHPARKTISDLKKKWLRLTTESYNLAMKSRIGLFVWLLRSYVVLGSIVPHAIFLMFTARLTHFDDRIRASNALFQIRFFRFLAAHRLYFKGIKP